MIQTATTIPSLSPRVVQSPRSLLRATDSLRDEAALVLGDAIDGVTGKQMNRAAVPTCGPYAISRAINGGDSNPLYRVACLFLLMKRLGMGRERAQRIVGWLQELIDAIWPEAEAGELADVLQKDQDLDVKDDALRLRAVLGCPDAVRSLLIEKRRQVAYGATVVLALRRRIAEQG